MIRAVYGTPASATILAAIANNRPPPPDTLATRASVDDGSGLSEMGLIVRI